MNTEVNNSTSSNNIYSNLNNNKNNKNNKIILIVLTIVIVLIILFLISQLANSTKIRKSVDNKQNEVSNNQTENIVENEEQINNTDNKNQDNVVNEDPANTNIIKKELGQTSNFDNGISVKVINSIEYTNGDAGGVYKKTMFIKIEIQNDSKKIFFQDNGLSYNIYKNFTENPIEMIDEDYNYTSFQIQPLYLLDDEVKTEKCYCALKKKISLDVGKIDKYGGYYDINYFALKPGEQTNAYILCYFKEGLEKAEIKSILLYNNSNQFLYFIN